MDKEIRQIMVNDSRIPAGVRALSGDDLSASAITWSADVKVMLAFEGACNVESPEIMVRRSTFDSLTSLRTAISELATLETAS